MNRVLIVGGGIGGMSTAIALARTGQQVSLIERDEGWRALGAGLTLNGAAVRRDEDSTGAFYGTEIPTRDILTGQVAPPPGSEVFLNSIREAKAQSASK